MSAVVVACRSEHVEHHRGFKGARFVFHAAWYDEALAGVNLEYVRARGEGESTGEHVDGLFVRMAVPRAAPARLHAVLDEHHLRSVREHATLEPRLRRRDRHGVRREQGQRGSSHAQPARSFERASATAATSARARSVSTASLPASSAAMSTSSAPTPSAEAPAAM